jgi:hypothetical protein
VHGSRRNEHFEKGEVPAAGHKQVCSKEGASQARIAAGEGCGEQHRRSVSRSRSGVAIAASAGWHSEARRHHGITPCMAAVGPNVIVATDTP